MLAQVREALRKYREKTQREKLHAAVRRAKEQAKAEAESLVASQARVAARAAETRRITQQGREKARAQMEARFEAARQKAQQETEAQERAYASFLECARFSDDNPDLHVYDDRGRLLALPEQNLEEDEWDTYPELVRKMKA